MMELFFAFSGKSTSKNIVGIFSSIEIARNAVVADYKSSNTKKAITYTIEKYILDSPEEVSFEIDLTIRYDADSKEVDISEAWVYRSSDIDIHPNLEIPVEKP